MINDRSSGADCFTNEFKLFWSTLNTLLLGQLILHEIDEWSSTNKLGINNCIPKQDNY